MDSAFRNFPRPRRPAFAFMAAVAARVCIVRGPDALRRISCGFAGRRGLFQLCGQERILVVSLSQMMRVAVVSGGKLLMETLFREKAAAERIGSG